MPLMKKGDGGVIEITSYCKNDEIYFDIVNNGPEISRESIGKIFDPFYTSKEVGKWYRSWSQPVLRYHT